MERKDGKRSEHPVQVSPSGIRTPDAPDLCQECVRGRLVGGGNPTLLFPFMAKPSYLHTNTNYVAAEHAGERRCLAAFMRARSVRTFPSFSLTSGQSAALEPRSSLY